MYRMDKPQSRRACVERSGVEMARACTATGVPSFSPHDLRHRRISLLHLSGVPWARIGEHVGQRNLAVTANTYTHVLSDETELDYERVVRRDGAPLKAGPRQEGQGLEGLTHLLDDALHRAFVEGAHRGRAEVGTRPSAGEPQVRWASRQCSRSLEPRSPPVKNAEKSLPGAAEWPFMGIPTA